MKNDMKAAVSPMEMDVRIFPYRGDGPVAAIASVTLNGCFAVRDVQLAKMFYDKEKMEKNIEKTTIKIQ